MAFDPIMHDLDYYLSQEDEPEEVDPNLESLAATEPAVVMSAKEWEANQELFDVGPDIRTEWQKKEDARAMAQADAAWAAWWKDKRRVA